MERNNNQQVPPSCSNEVSWKWWGSLKFNTASSSMHVFNIMSWGGFSPTAHYMMWAQATKHLICGIYFIGVQLWHLDPIIFSSRMGHFCVAAAQIWFSETPGWLICKNIQSPILVASAVSRTDCAFMAFILIQTYLRGRNRPNNLNPFKTCKRVKKIVIVKHKRVSALTSCGFFVFITHLAKPACAECFLMRIYHKRQSSLVHADLEWW